MARPRSAEQLACDAIDEVIVVRGHFPLGAHIFPANTEVICALDAAVVAALRELSIVTPLEIEARRAATRRAFAIEPATEPSGQSGAAHRELIERLGSESSEAVQRLLRTAKQPFSFPELRALIARHRPAFEARHRSMRSKLTTAAVGKIAVALEFSVDETVARLQLTRTGKGFEIATALHATLARRLDRLALVRGFSAPDVIIAHELDAARRVASPGWQLAIDVDAAIPDRVFAATIVDAERAFGDGPRLLTVSITELVLLALQCGVDPEARSIDEGRCEDLEWTRLGGSHEVEDVIPAELPEGAIMLAPDLGDTEVAVTRLEFALVPASSPLRVLAPGGAVVAITIECSDEG